MKCPLCHHAVSRRLFRTASFDTGRGPEPQKYTLRRCGRCGLIFISPQPSDSSYPDDYRPHQKPKEKISRRKIKRLTDEIAGSPGRSNYLLDIGCGAGSDLRTFRQMGWTVKGIEVNESACDHARQAGLEVFCGTLTQARFPDNTFDIVRLRHVLEHLADPDRTLAEIKRILKPGGRVVIITPNIRSFNFSFFRQYWYHLDIPRHLCLFNEASLKQSAFRLGFKIHRIKYDSGTKGLRESIQRWATNHQNPLSLLLQSLNFPRISLFKHLFAPLTLCLDTLRWGDTIRIVFKK